jgi:uncharacterized damage-inducible protein DinB
MVMPTQDLFLSLYAYPIWANRRILDCAERFSLRSLDDSQLSGPVTVRDRNGDESAMILRDMLAHLLIHSVQHRSEAAAVL